MMMRLRSPWAWLCGRCQGGHFGNASCGDGPDVGRYASEGLVSGHCLYSRERQPSVQGADCEARSERVRRQSINADTCLFGALSNYGTDCRTRQGGRPNLVPTIDRSKHWPALNSRCCEPALQSSDGAQRPIQSWQREISALSKLIGLAPSDQKGASAPGEANVVDLESN